MDPRYCGLCLGSLSGGLGLLAGVLLVHSEDVVTDLSTLGEGHVCQLVAVVEGQLADLLHGGGKLNGGQVAAHPECAVVNGLQGSGQGEGGQLAALPECVLAYGLQGLTEGDGCERSA